MVDAARSHAAAWVVAAVLLVLLFLSFAGTGTFMGGIGMGWMLLWPLVLLGVVAYLAYQSGRTAPKQ